MSPRGQPLAISVTRSTPAGQVIGFGSKEGLIPAAIAAPVPAAAFRDARANPRHQGQDEGDHQADGGRSCLANLATTRDGSWPAGRACRTFYTATTSNAATVGPTEINSGRGGKRT